MINISNLKKNVGQTLCKQEFSKLHRKNGVIVDNNAVLKKFTVKNITIASASCKIARLLQINYFRVLESRNLSRGSDNNNIFYREMLRK